MDYVVASSPAALLGDDVLAVLGFGAAAPAALADPRYLRVPLQPHGAAPYEVWRTGQPVRCGRDGEIAWATDGALSFGVIEVEEAHGIAEQRRRAGRGDVVHAQLRQRFGRQRMRAAHDRPACRVSPAKVSRSCRRRRHQLRSALGAIDSAVIA